jgi:P4 family phage/plasmid primase-like protien
MIPEAFKKFPQFIAWTLVDKGGKKPDKIPTDPLTGYPINPLDPAVWMGADAAMQYATMGWGIGFVFTEADPFFFLDIDNCLQPTGECSNLAAHMCGTFVRCYVEVSQSGTGLHIIGSGVYPAHGCKNTSLNIELYTEKRFCALTGTNAVGDAGFVNQGAIDTLIATYFPADAEGPIGDWTTGPCDEWYGIEDDEKLLMKMVKSKSAAATFGTRATIKDLWTANSVALAKYYPDPQRDFDHSSADAALISHLAFWTGKDCQRMDRLFRQSSLMRDKWDRKEGTYGSYGNRSILKGCGQCTNVYGTSAAELPPGTAEKYKWDYDTAEDKIIELTAGDSKNREHVKLIDVTVQEILENNTFSLIELNSIRNLLKEKLNIRKGIVDSIIKAAVKGNSGNTPALTHHDMVIELKQEFTNKYPPGHIGANGQLYSYNGKHWKGELLKKMHGIVAEKFNDEPRCARKTDYAGVSNHYYDCNEDPGFFADRPTGIAVPSGFIRICHETGKISTEPHSPNHLQQFHLPADPDMSGNPLEKAPMFFRFLHDSLHGEDMEEQVILLQEVAGGVIAGVMRKMHKVVFLKGGGRNGKGVYLDIVSGLVPKAYISAITPFQWDREYYLAGLAGKLLNIVGELDGSKPIPAEAFKTVTGGDLLSGREVYGKVFEFYNEAAHLFSGNHFIKNLAHSQGFYDRWIMINFPHKISASDRIIDLGKIIVTAELPQILGWALQGAQRLIINNRFSTGKVHTKLMASWRNIADNVTAFLNDPTEIKIDPNQNINSLFLFVKYKLWCGNTGYKPLGRNNFYDRIENTTIDGVKLKQVTVHGAKCFKGIRIADGPAMLGSVEKPNGYGSQGGV